MVTSKAAVLLVRIETLFHVSPNGQRPAEEERTVWASWLALCESPLLLCAEESLNRLDSSSDKWS